MRKERGASASANEKDQGQVNEGRNGVVCEERKGNDGREDGKRARNKEWGSESDGASVWELIAVRVCRESRSRER